MITIMPICENDLEGLKILYDKGFEGTHIDFIEMKKVFVWMNENPDYNVLCAKLNGKIVGSIMEIVNRELIGKCKPYMVIENVIVSNECRRMGVGKMLMNYIDKVAIENECTYIMLLSRMHRKEAHLFYESVGFSGDAAKGFKKYLS